MGDWTVAGGSGGGWLVAVDLLVFIKILIFLMADVACDFFHQSLYLLYVLPQLTTPKLRELIFEVQEGNNLNF